MIHDFKPGRREWKVGDRAIICISSGTLSGDCRVTRVTDKLVTVKVLHYTQPCRFKLEDSTPSTPNGNFGASGIMTEKEARELMDQYKAGRRQSIPGYPTLYIGQGAI